jgi:hypothetical protein
MALILRSVSIRLNITIPKKFLFEIKIVYSMDKKRPKFYFLKIESMNRLVLKFVCRVMSEFSITE